MPEPASNAPAIPEATSRRRLYRRPWVLLSLAGLAVFGSIPFAIRGYQLSLIPDIPDPFADQPEVEIREHNAAASDVIEQFLRGYERLDEELWIGNEKPDYEDHKQFLSELSEASQQGLDGATPRVKKYFQENRDLIGLWFNLLDMGAIAPIEQQRPAYPGFYAATSRELLDLLSIAAISQVDSGDPQAAMKLALTAVRKLNRASVQDFGAWRGLYFARVRVWKLIAELSQRPVVNEAVLADCLGVALSLSAASDEFRILELQVEYAATVEHFDDSDLTWVSAKFLSLPEWTGSMSAYVLGEPTLSKRILRHIYHNYRTQALLPRAERPPVDGVLHDRRFVRWFRLSGAGVVSDDDLRLAVKSAPLLRHSGVAASVLNFFDAESSRLTQFQTVIACQLYLRRNERLPDSLDHLVPEYLKSVPVDSFSPTGEPLRYKLRTSEAELYSLWTNGIDDGGFFRPELAPRSQRFDSGFIIRDLINHSEQAETPEKLE